MRLRAVTPLPDCALRSAALRCAHAGAPGAGAVAKLVPLGLKVSMAEVRQKIGFGEPDEGEDVLTAPASGKLPAAKTDDAIAKG